MIVGVDSKGVEDHVTEVRANVVSDGDGLDYETESG